MRHSLIVFIFIQDLSWHVAFSYSQSLYFMILALSHAVYGLPPLPPDSTMDLISRSCRQHRAFDASIYYGIYTNMLDDMTYDMEYEKFSMKTGGDELNKLYVMSQCMGYLTSEECSKCFTECSAYLSSCFSSTGGRVFLEGCFIRAENYNFFQEAIGPGDNVSCSNNPVKSPSYNATVKTLTYNLVKKASIEQFALGDVITEFVHVYGAAMCWKSLNIEGCTTCLELAAKSSLACLPNRAAYAMFTGCILRYADYKFTDSVDSPAVSGRIVYLLYGLFAIFISIFTVIFGCHLGRYTRNQANSIGKAKKFPLLKDIFNFKYSALEKATRNFSEDQKLGQGGYGEVYKGTFADGREIAIKRLFIGTKSGKEQVFNEIDIINQAQHRNLVHFLGCCFTTTDIFIIYEFLPNKSLDLILFDSEKKKELDWKRRLGIILGTAEGLDYLHKDCHVQIIHRDIKASNILLDLKYRPKISDFGLAQIYSGHKALESTAIAGTLGYMAPEYLAQGRLTEKVDVYSYGVLVLEIVSGERNNKVSSEETFDTVVTEMWRHYESKSLEKVIDSSLGNEDLEDIKRVVQVGLLCTQESQSVRPAMTVVVQMLKRKDTELPKPTKPPFTDESLEFTSPLNIDTLNVPAVQKPSRNR